MAHISFQKMKDHRQDAKSAKKNNRNILAVLLGIASGDTRDKKKLGVLAPWR
jgi:hypothetical protein